MQEHIYHIREHLEGIVNKSAGRANGTFIRGFVAAISILLDKIEEDI